MQSRYILPSIIRLFAYAKGKFFGFYVNGVTLADGMDFLPYGGLVPDISQVAHGTSKAAINYLTKLIAVLRVTHLLIPLDRFSLFPAALAWPPRSTEI